jgi:uncharacterized membrane protein
MATTTTEPARTNSQRPAYQAGAMLIGIGVGHFLAPKPFDTIIPAELPGDPRFYTYASGIAEVGIGTMLLVPRTRGKPWPMKVAALARLPFQLPMITKALAIRRNAPRY